MFLGGSWVGRLYDNYGPRYILLVGRSIGGLCTRIITNRVKVGSFLHVFGLMMASISKEYYQFLLAQAVCSSIGASMVFYPAFSAVVTWFFKKRAMAVGIAAAGSSLGGLIFPIMVQRLVVEIGFGWTMRTCAFLILALLIVANLFIKSRIPPHPRPVKLMDFIMPLTEPTFALLTTVWLPFPPILSIVADDTLGHVLILHGPFHTFHIHHSRSYCERNGRKSGRLSGLYIECCKHLRAYSSRLCRRPLPRPLQRVDCNGDCHHDSRARDVDTRQ